MKVKELVEYDVLVGAVDWHHLHWRSAFYPDDLPDEWQLSFYNTQYRCVYLTQSIWRNSTSEQIQTWLTDTLPNFRFILESPGPDEDGLAPILQLAGNRALIEPNGLADSKLVWFDREPDIRALGKEIREAVDNRVVLFLISRDAHLPAMEKVKSLVEIMGY
jgi:hypothetical protein